MSRPKEKTRSNVRSFLCVGPETYCFKLKESVSVKNSDAALQKGLSIWKLKSPIIKTLSSLIIVDKKSKKLV